jgi:hypothetical protein
MMGNIWADLGLDDNPYDPRPLSIDAQDRKLFVGRTEALNEFNTLLSSTKGGIVIVEGGVGVGKTSFVNIGLYDKCKSDNYLPCDKIELDGNMDIVQFVLSVFSNMFHSIEKYDKTGRLDKFPIHTEARTLLNQTIQSSWGGNIQILGTGGGGGRQRSVTAPVAVILSSIIPVMNKWMDFVINKLNYSAIIVPIDNLDIIDDVQIVDFLNKVRDTLMGFHGIWWILVGKPNLFSLLEGKANRVSEMVTGNPIKLNPLSKKEVHEMIKLRIKNLSKNKITPPIPDKVIDILYDVSKGEARYILKRCGDLILKFRTKFPSEKAVPEKTAIEILAIMAREKIEAANLSNSDRKTLGNMAKKGRFQNKDYKHFGKPSAQNFNYLVKKLLSLGLLAREQSSGKDVYYHTTGDVNMVFEA